MGSKSLRIQQVDIVCEGGPVMYEQNGTGWTRGTHFQIIGGIESYLQEGKEGRCFN